MRFTATSLEGVVVVESDPHEDARGSFSRIWCAKEFAEHGLRAELVQCSISRNRRAGTLRGMHFQRAPNEETKLVTCVRGAMFDVALDLREDSSSHLKWFGIELEECNGRALYIPHGVAHGFQTLLDGTDVLYQMSDWFAPESAAGFRWNDAAFNIQWPIREPILSGRDAAFPPHGAAPAGCGL